MLHSRASNCRRRDDEVKLMRFGRTSVILLIFLMHFFWKGKSFSINTLPCTTKNGWMCILQEDTFRGKAQPAFCMCLTHIWIPRFKFMIDKSGTRLRAVVTKYYKRIFILWLQSVFFPCTAETHFTVITRYFPMELISEKIGAFDHLGNALRVQRN